MKRRINNSKLKLASKVSDRSGHPSCNATIPQECKDRYRSISQRRSGLLVVDGDVPTIWPEAEIVNAPCKPPAKGTFEPRVLVRRHVRELAGPKDERVFCEQGPRAISLFTGAGGFDLGVEAAGFVTVVQHEWSVDCCQTLIANRPRAFRHAALIQGDIRHTPTSMILREGNLRVGEADLLIGGPPCQGFSTAGKRRPADARNDLVFEYLRVLRESMPHYFSMENVPGFLSFNKGAYLEAFLRAAHECYYELVYGLVNAVEYGVPQNRTRFICMGTRRDICEIEDKLASLPAPTHFHPPDLHRLQIMERMPLWNEEAQLLRHPPGIRFFPDRPILIPPRPDRTNNSGEGEGGRSKRFIDFYRRLKCEEPDRIVSRPTGGKAVA